MSSSHTPYNSSNPSAYIPGLESLSIQALSTNISNIISTNTEIFVSDVAINKTNPTPTPLIAGNLIGNIPSSVLGNSSLYIGTTSIPLNRNSAIQGIIGISSIIGGSEVTDKLQLQGTSGEGRVTSSAIEINVGNNGDTNAVTVFNNGNVTIGDATQNHALFNVSRAGEVYDLSVSEYWPYYTKGTLMTIASNPNSVNTGSLIEFNAYNASNYASGVFIGATAGTGINGPANFVIGRRTGAQTWLESMRIDTAGNVGIGTSSPKGKLDITTIGGSYGTDALVLGGGTIPYPTAQYSGWGGIVLKGTTSDARILCQDGNGRINTYWNAYYDIGGYKYIVSGEPAVRQQITVNGSTGGYYAIYGAPSGTAGAVLTWTQYSALSDTAAWLSPRGTNSDFYINSSGNIGIGTVNPGKKLEIFDDTLTTGYIQGLRITGNGSTYFDIGRNVTTGSFIIQGNQAGYNNIVLAPTSGNVGIGQDTPDTPASLLHLNKNASGNSITSTPSIIISNRESTSGTFISGGIFSNTYRDIRDSNITAGMWFERQNSFISGSASTQGAIVFGTMDSNADWLLPTQRMRIAADGNVCIDATSGSYKLTLGSDSAAKPSTATWTISSDERLKENIIPADLDRCSEIVKTVPLKRYTWKDDVYTIETVGDRSKLGWIAQDVKPLFNKAVNAHTQTLLTSTTTQEEYEEQDYAIEIVPKTVVEVKIIAGVPTQVTNVVDEEVKTLLYKDVAVIDEEGKPVINEDETPLLHQVPIMVTKTRDKVVYDELTDCLDLQVDQIYAAMYGAIQSLQLKVEALEKEMVK